MGSVGEEGEVGRWKLRRGYLARVVEEAVDHLLACDKHPLMVVAEVAGRLLDLHMWRVRKLVNL